VQRLKHAEHPHRIDKDLEILILGDWAVPRIGEDTIDGDVGPGGARTP
jgi:hypothetical protein